MRPPPADAIVEQFEKIVFFDGNCGFCDRSVSLLFARDKKHVLRFAPLQGTTAARLLSRERLANLNTIVYRRDSRDFERSAAVLMILWDMGGLSAWAALLLAVPAPLRDFAYRVFAANRYRWFGRLDACRVPTAAERRYFLD